MKKRCALLLLALLILALPLVAEVDPKSLSVSQTVASYEFPSGTKVVTIISDGSSTCFYRLFSNQDTPAAATASSTGNLQLKSGEAKTYDMTRHSNEVTPTSQGSATWWKSISAICSSGQTATWRLESF